MSNLTVFLIGIGLSMDAFSVAICKGLSMKKVNLKNMCIVGLYFGLFQAIMPILGFLLGSTFYSFVDKIDHYLSFILLGIIGFNMIKESFSLKDEVSDDSLSFKSMFILAIATSIDALAVGVTFSFEDVNIFLAITIIGITTFILSSIGVKIGHVFGSKYKKKAELLGGIILIIIGIKILIEGIL